MMQRGLTVFIICCTMKWKTKLAEQNKGKAPLGKAVTRLWSYLTCLQRDRLWCSEKSSQAVTYSPKNNCQTCSWAHWLPCRQHRRELFLFVQLFLLFCMLCCVASWVLLHDMPFWRRECLPLTVRVQAGNKGTSTSVTSRGQVLWR